MGNLRGVMGNDVIKGKLSIGKGEQGEQGLQGEKGDTGKSIEYNWRGTELGIRQEGTTEYEYVDLKGGVGTGDTHRHMNKAELDKITIGDVAKWNNYTPTWEQIEGKPGNFNPSTHRHNASEIDGLPTSAPSFKEIIVDVPRYTNTITLSTVYSKFDLYDVTHGLALTKLFNYTATNNVLTVPIYNYSVKYKILVYMEG